MKTKEEKNAFADARLLTFLLNKNPANRKCYTFLNVRYWSIKYAISGIIFSKEGNFECAFTYVRWSLGQLENPCYEEVICAWFGVVNVAIMEQVIDYDESSNSNSRFDVSDCSTDAADSVSGTAGTKQTVKSLGFFYFFFSYVCES